jgi:glycosyltransferase involved in cell wall biosynthesis
VKDFSRAILDLAGDEALRNQLGEGGRKRAREKFNGALHIERMEAVLEAAASILA